MGHDISVIFTWSVTLMVGLRCSYYIKDLSLVVWNLPDKALL